MGLDIGIIRVTYLDRPDGMAYEFAKEMAVEASVGGYMHGEGNNWAAFTQHRVLEMVEEFSRDRNLAAGETQEVLEWVRSLPWTGWDDAYDPQMGSGEDSGFIELHFNW